MKPPHPTITALAVSVSVVAGALASPGLADPIHKLFGQGGGDQVQAAATILAALAAVIAGAGHSMLQAPPDAPKPPDQPTASAPTTAPLNGVANVPPIPTVPATPVKVPNP